MAAAIADVKRTDPKTTVNLTTETRAASISAYGPARSTASGAPLSPEELEQIDAYWRASLYLCLGMLYLQDNPLLPQPLKLQHVKPRMLGHWGSDAGPTFTYIPFNPLIKKYALDPTHISRPAPRAPPLPSPPPPPG